jgi:hypothetical protein
MVRRSADRVSTAAKSTLALALACLVLLAGGSRTCPKYDPARKPAVIFVLYDLSGTAKDARANYIAYTKELLQNAAPGDVIVGDAISSGSLSTESYVLRGEFSPYANPTYSAFDTTSEKFDKACVAADDKFKREIEDAEKKSEEFLTNQPPSALTQIMSGVYGSTRVFQTYPEHRRVLVVFSDGVEDSEIAKFDKQLPTEALTNSILQKLSSGGRLPDLSGVKVFFIGAAPNSLRIVKSADEDYIAVKKFWLQYFQKTGASLEEKNYGTKPVRMSF